MYWNKDKLFVINLETEWGKYFYQVQLEFPTDQLDWLTAVVVVVVIVAFTNGNAVLYSRLCPKFNSVAKKYSEDLFQRQENSFSFCSVNYSAQQIFENNNQR